MKWLKAKIGLLAIALVWGSMIVTMLPLMVIAHFVDQVSQHNKPLPFDLRWTHSLLLAQDILTNVILGGHYRTTISSELGHQQTESRSAAVAARSVDWLFKVTTGEVDHCKNSIEQEDRHLYTPLRGVVGFTSYAFSIALFIKIIS